MYSRMSSPEVNLSHFCPGRAERRPSRDRAREVDATRCRAYPVVSAPPMPRGHAEAVLEEGPRSGQASAWPLGMKKSHENTRCMASRPCWVVRSAVLWGACFLLVQEWVRLRSWVRYAASAWTSAGYRKFSPKCGRRLLYSHTACSNAFRACAFVRNVRSSSYSCLRTPFTRSANAFS